MINIEFTEEEKNSLYSERFHHPHPRVQLKMEVLWLKSQKIPPPKICQLAGISPNTLLTYLRDDQEGEIKKLKEINLYRPKSELESQRETLKKYFEKNPPATINEAGYRREELTGIKRSTTQVRKFLKSMGMKCIKVGSLPSKADRDEQEDYKEKKLEPRLNEAKEGKRAVFLLMPLTLLWELFSVLVF